MVEINPKVAAKILDGSEDHLVDPPEEEECFQDSECYDPDHDMYGCTIHDYISNDVLEITESWECMNCAGSWETTQRWVRA